MAGSISDDRRREKNKADEGDQEDIAALAMEAVRCDDRNQLGPLRLIHEVEAPAPE
jgi:hypothetical protein